jgi:putative nucleotidyltransferase with HDIG domain
MKSVNKTNEELVIDAIRTLISGTEFENKVFLAGGSVRDELMGLKPKDLDFTALGDTIDSGINFAIWLSEKLGIHRVDKNPVIYERFGTAALSLSGNNLDLPNVILEFVTPRKEVYTSGSRKPLVSSGKLIDDVMRRDFTINSLLKNVSTNEVIDLTNKGISDIKNGFIRTTNNHDIIFTEDPLRMVRFIRFITKFNFDFDQNAFEFIKNNTNLINNISIERVNEELCKILLTDKPSVGLQLLLDSGLLSVIIPELVENVGVTQNKFHHKDVFGHILDVVDNTPKNLKARLTALFHDIGKKQTKTISHSGSVNFHGHEDLGASITVSVMERLKFSNDMIQSVFNGVRLHMRLKHGTDDCSKLSNKSLRKFIHNASHDLEVLLDVIHADNISHSELGSMPNQISIVRDRISKLDAVVNPKNGKLLLPLNGDDIMVHFNLKKGKIIGELLKECEEFWLDNPKITKDELLLELAKSKVLSN